MSVTSSRTPGIEENSCSTPSILIDGDRRALQRGQQHAPQRDAQRQAEAALQRLGDDGGRTAGGRRRPDVELVRLDQVLPVLLITVATFRWSVFGARRPHALRTRCTAPSAPRPDNASLDAPALSADGSRYAGSGVTSLIEVTGEADGLQRAQRRFAARTRTLDQDLQVLHPVFHAPCGLRLRR